MSFTPPKALWVFMHPVKDISKMDAYETLAYPYEPTHSALKYLAEKYINHQHVKVIELELESLRKERDDYRYVLEELEGAGWPMEIEGEQFDSGIYYKVARKILEKYPKEDQTPCCSVCGGKRKNHCICGPIADNE